MQDYSSKKHERGITLVDVVVASFIAIIAATSVAGLLIQANRASEVGRHRSIATGLAREGLELVRLARDEMWNAGNSMRDEWGFCSDRDDNYIIDLHTYAQNNGLLPQSENNHRLIRHSNVLRHPVNVSGESSGYSRVVNIDCESLNDDGYIEVEVVVDWNVRGNQDSIAVRERLYDWGR